MTYRPTVPWDRITGTPSEYPPEAHGHAQGDVTNLTTDLAAKAPASDLTTHVGLSTAAHGGIVASTDGRLTDAREPTAHGHAEADVTGLVTDLAATEKTVNKGAPGGYASLDVGGHVPTELLPPA